MGQASSNPGSTFYALGGEGSQAPLRFSSRHGDNCQILRDGSQARRAESFCKGIVFSDRPVEVGERVCLRLTELSIRWSGVLRLGFSSHDPLTIPTLPKYACPDLTGKPGFWAKALAEKYAESNALIHYYYTANGDVHYGVNGTDKGLFFSGLDTRQPLWCLVDLYGNCTAVELIDMRRSLNNFVGDIQEEEEESEDSGDSPQHVSQSDTVENVSNTLNNLTAAGEEDNDVSAPLRYNSRCHFRPLGFHRVTGVNVSLDGSGSVATRHEDEYSGGYVFTRDPVTLGERYVIQILATENMYIGSLAFGVTSCDPASLESGDLPEDADMLLDRAEYWVVTKDVDSAPDTWDELSFTVKTDGSVEFFRNGGPATVLMHVDTSVRLWPFWDVYGNTQRLRLVGVTRDRLEPDIQHATRENDRNNHVMTDSMTEASSSLQPPPLPPRSRSSHNIAGGGQASGPAGEECKICYEAPVDCVLYMCGHMCLCYQVTPTQSSPASQHSLFSAPCSSGRVGEEGSVRCAGSQYRTSSRSTGPSTPKPLK